MFSPSDLALVPANTLSAKMPQEAAYNSPKNLKFFKFPGETVSDIY
jgi:hypothetical protein